MITNLKRFQASQFLRRMIASVSLFLVMYTLSPAVLAADTLSPVVTDTGYSKDLSTNFLAVIFGGVSDAYVEVLGADKTGALGYAFKIYNGFISIVGAVMVMFITIVGVVNSANSGTPMGQKWHTLFLPARVTIGAGMLIPMGAYNYNLAQVVVMWFILTGVHGADKVWSGVINMQWGAGEQGVLGASVAEANELGSAEALLFYRNAILFGVCLGGVAADPAPETPLSTDLACYNGNTVSADCSDANYIRPADYPNGMSTKCGDLGVALSGFSNYPAQKALVVRDLMRFVSSFAESVKQETLNSNGVTILSKINNLITNTPRLILLAPGLRNNVEVTFGTLINNITEIKRDSALSSDEAEKKRKAIRQGWIMAGAHYYNLIKGQSSSATEPPKNLSEVKQYASAPAYILSAPSELRTGLNTISEQVQKFTADLIAGSGTYTPAKPDIFDDAEANFSPSMQLPKVMRIFSLGLMDMIVLIAKGFLKTDKLFDYPSSIDVTDINSLKSALAKDPLKGVSASGAKIIEIVETTVVVMIGAMVAVIVGFGVLGAATYSSITVVALAIFSSLFTGVMGIMMIFFPLGVMHAMYIPMVPFIIYMFGAVGWLLICVEAMAAGPIVAVGLMHPEGNEVLGKAEQGLNMILNLMLRPVLMVLGLLAGMVVVRVVCLFFSIGINIVTDSGLINMKWVTILIGMIFFYTAFIYYLVHESFSLINRIPDKVLGWIGANVQGIGDASSFLGGAKDNVKEGGGMAGSTGGKVVSGAQGVAATVSNQFSQGSGDKEGGGSKGGGAKGGE